VATLLGLAVGVGERQGPVAALTRVAEAALSVLPAADAASLVMTGSGGAGGRLLWASDPLSHALDQAQLAHRDGPAWHVAGEEAGQVELVTDLAVERRWPAFTTRAVRLGVHSVLSVSAGVLDPRVDATAQEQVALNLYAKRAGGLTPQSAEIVLLMLLLATQAMRGQDALAAAGDLALHLRRGMATRTTIGQAQGVLMERYRLTPEDAFDRLRITSQDLNRKLREVAAEVAATGVEPQRPGRR
jgi:hypothetical protein